MSENKSNDSDPIPQHTTGPRHTSVPPYMPPALQPDDIKSCAILTRSGMFISFDILYKQVKQANPSYDVDTITDTVISIVSKLQNKFTVRIKNMMTKTSYPRRGCMVDKKNKRIILPRFCHEAFVKKYFLQNVSIKCMLTGGELPKKPFVFKGTLNANQLLIVDEIMNKYYNREKVLRGESGLILNLEAGQGKSFIASYLISLIQRKTLVICHTTNIVGQWAKVLSYLYDNPVGYYYSGSGNKRDGDIVLTIINSASFTKLFTFKQITHRMVNGKIVGKPIVNEVTMEPMTYFAQFGFVICDECHEYTGAKFIDAFKRCQSIYMLGLSATPDESIFGVDPFAWWNIGPVMVANEIPGFDSKAGQFKGVVEKIEYYGHDIFTPYITRMERFDAIAVMSVVTQDPVRNLIIIEKTKELLENGHNIFIFSDRREHLLELNKLMLIQGIEVEIKADKSDETENKDKKDKKDKKDTKDKKKKDKKKDDSSDDSDDSSDSSDDSSDSSSDDSSDDSSDSSDDSSSDESIDELNEIEEELDAYKASVASTHETRKIHSVMGGASNKDMDNAEAHARVILTTYKYMGTGKSIIKMTALILATPRRNKSRQFVNRIFRLGSDMTKTRVIVDIVDMKSNLKNQWNDRQRYYKSKEYPITKTPLKVDASYLPLIKHYIINDLFARSSNKSIEITKEQIKKEILGSADVKQYYLDFLKSVQLNPQ